MKELQDLIKAGLLIAASVFMTTPMMAQCGTFADAANSDQAETYHVLYRGDVKNKNFDAAFENWKNAYEAAPAADGQRHSHFSDGRKILKHKYDNAKDDAKKKEYQDWILKLYDEQITCYKNDAYLLGRKAFDMFYTFNTPYDQTLAVLKSSVEKGGNDSEYIVLDPYARIVVHQFTNDLMSKADARALYDQLNGIADHNIEKNEKFKEQFVAAKASMNQSFMKIENHIFDCDYWKVKLMPEYEADKNNPEVVKSLFNKLRGQGCTNEDPFMMELKTKYESYAAAENAKRKAEYELSNPAIMAKKAYDAGDYAGALAKYQEALNEVTDPVKQGEIYFSMASIEGRKLNNLSKGREYARKAAKLKTGWGRPYMLIGDLYAKGSRKCGDSFMQRCAILAALDKYAYAKSIDSSVAGDASSRISKYNSSKPDKETAFMMGHKEGSSVKVGCWIGETVKLRF